jgi:hypothetical protein
MSDDYQWRIGIFFDAVKALGTGNTAGLAGAGVALHYFASRDPPIIWHIKAAAAWYLIGIALFAAAYFSLFVALTLVPPNTEKPKTTPPSPTPDAHSILIGCGVISGFGSFAVWIIGTCIAAKVIYLL